MKPTTIAGTVLAVIAAVLLFGCASKHESLGPNGAPANVMASFHEKYPGSTVRNVEKEVYKDGTVHWEIEYTDQNGKNRDVELDSAGNFAH